MGYRIIKYKPKQWGGKYYTIAAKIEKLNFFGCVTETFWEELDSTFKLHHQKYFSDYLEACSSLQCAKKEAKAICRALNRLFVK